MISAQFAAYLWFQAQPENAAKDHGEAMRFARRQWRGFLPIADRGVGRLLLRLVDLPTEREQKRRLARAVCQGPPDQAAVGESPTPIAGGPPLPFSCN